LLLSHISSKGVGSDLLLQPDQIQLSMWSPDILKPGGSGQHLSPQSFKPETETETEKNNNFG
jgi:hypothetical protein